MIVGIDLGTSTSEIAILKNGKPMIIQEIAGAPRGILPSVVAIDSDGELKVGELADKLLVPKPQLAVEEVKRHMGTDKKIALGAETFAPEEISAMILRHLKNQAEIFLGEPVDEAVITVPAHFNELQRRATRDAGELAGLRVRRLLNEPTAAALAYGIERHGIEEKVAVFDLGGGTLDVTVLELSEGVLDILASTGDTQLGGKNFDERLMAHLRDKCREITGVDLDSPQLDHRRRLLLKGQLKSVAKRAKEELSSVNTTQISMPFIGIEADGSPINFDYRLSRREFESLIRDLVESTRQQLDEAIAAKRLTPAEIDTVLMVGGSTRIPLVRDFVSGYFGGRQLRSEVHPDEAVALGAAVLSGIEGRVLDTNEIVITDVSNWTLGVSVISEYEGTFTEDSFDPLIKKFSTIPRSARKQYRTAHDWQRSVRVEVYQGDQPFCKDNVFVGQFELEISEPALAGQPIEIEFSYDLNEELLVTARDLRSGRAASARIRASGGGMSEGDKKASVDRLNQKWQGKNESSTPPASARAAHAASSNPAAETWTASPLYPGVAALITHAEKRRSSAPPSISTTISKLLEQMKASIEEGNEGALRVAEGKLTDLLFDLD